MTSLDRPRRASVTDAPITDAPITGARLTDAWLSLDG
jgi:hypothetical protein